MYFEPEDDEEELYALRGALAGTRTPTGCIGFLGLAGSGLMVVAGVMMMLSPGFGSSGVGVGVVYLIMAALYALGPGILTASAMQRPKTLEDNTAAVRQARLLMVFWWLAAVMVLGTTALYFFAFLFAFAGAGLML